MTEKIKNKISLGRAAIKSENKQEPADYDDRNVLKEKDWDVQAVCDLSMQ